MFAAWALVGLLLPPDQPPESVARVGSRLSAAGFDVRVEREQGAWEVWVDSDKPASDAAMRALTGQRPVTAIRIMAGGFSDAGVKCLTGLPNLRLLVLRSAKLTDASLKPICRLSSLDKLDLMEAKLTSQGLSRLQSLPKLTRLYLHGARFAERDAFALGRLTHLEVLYLPASFSAATIEVLRKALPNTDVETI